MKTGKNIYDAFRESEQKLATPPPPRAWEKLDKKLSVSRRRTRVIHSKHIALTVTVLLLATLLFYLVDMQRRKKIENLNNPQKTTSPAFEPLEDNSDCLPYWMKPE